VVASIVRPVRELTRAAYQAAHHTLPERTLGYISELEAQEQDPDVLARLLRLDHATTRIRRNTSGRTSSGPALPFEALVHTTTRHRCALRHSATDHGLPLVVAVNRFEGRRNLGWTRSAR
jgi:hypothetical protein